MEAEKEKTAHINKNGEKNTTSPRGLRAESKIKKKSAALSLGTRPRLLDVLWRAVLRAARVGRSRQAGKCREKKGSPSCELIRARRGLAKRRYRDCRRRCQGNLCAAGGGLVQREEGKQVFAARE